MSKQIAQGLHEALVTHGVREVLDALTAKGTPWQVERQSLDWLDDALSRHVVVLLRRTLADLGGDVTARVALVERLLTTLAEGADPVVEVPADLPTVGRDALTWVGPEKVGLAAPVAPPRPEHGLVQPSLLFNGSGDISLFHELEREIASADRIDAIVSFLRFSGFRILEPALRRFQERGGELRLITSTYTGATEARAVTELCDVGRVRVAWEEDGTRLHAKAWLFHRSSGLSTAYVGSSNLSRSALVDGAEWNVRATQAITPAVVERFVAAFDQLWASLDPDFDPVNDLDRLVRALSRDDRATIPFLRVDASPKPHQVQVLDALEAERAHGHTATLVVAATGTGKTWVAAFDYRALRASGRADRLLFVAHRKRILEQSLGVFRTVLQDPGFGELLVDGLVPVRGTHVFASIQSLGSWHPAQDDFDVVIVDEFHHAAAKTYAELLEQLKPRFLVGLTATPERADGKSVFRFFSDRVASEVRLWEALDANLLAPFHYFGVHDPTSAETAWTRGRLDPAALDRLYTGDDLRARRILEAVGRYVADPRRMKAIGFCVGKGHAEVMAGTFRDAGIAAGVLHSDVPSSDRNELLDGLANGALQVLFTVDLLNEGVDVPSVDTVLFLRPTESATVFLQQLGRGLRKNAGKSHLTVLDFVGHVHNEYRYDVRYRALLGGTRKDAVDAVERGFPRLPAGCAMVLEEQARDVVLASVRRFADSARWKLLVDDLRPLPASTGLAAFLRQADAELEDVYQPVRGRTWTVLRRDAGHERRAEGDGEVVVRRRLSRLLHVDDDQRLRTWSAWLRRPEAPRMDGLEAEEQGLARMLFAALGDRRRLLAELDQELAGIWAFAAVREEAAELFDVLLDRVRHRTLPVEGLPVAVHGTYTRAEVVAAYGAVAKGRLRESREGPMYVESARTHVLFVTLDKSDEAFRPSIRYADYPISATRFHWESQNHTHDGTAVGRAYVEHEARGDDVVLFVRERPEDARGATPFTCLGRARYVSHVGGRPMQIVWALDAPMPGWVLAQGRVVAA